MDIEQLKKFINLNSPLLFIGAGFNYGIEKDTIKIPLGDELKKELISHLEISGITDEWGGFHLQDVIEVFNEEIGIEALNSWLVERFSNYYPTPLQKKIISFPWKKIYTTNIDDIVEKVFEEKKINFISQNTSYKQRNMNNYTELIKLHGCVRNVSGNFVFSKSDYLSNHIHEHKFALLAQDIISEPFIILGSQFDEEHILSMIRTILDSNRILKVQHKSFLIAPALSPRIKRSLKNINAEWIKGTTDDFLEMLGTFELTKFETLELHVKYSGFKYINEVVSGPKQKDIQPKLYFGEQPTWDDIANNIDVVDDEKNEFVKNSIKDDKHMHFVILGKRCSGKTTLLKRIGYFLSQEGYSVWEYSDDIFSWSSWSYYVNRAPTLKKIALLVDDASRLYHDINRLFNAIYPDTQLIIISTSSSFKHYKKKYALKDYHPYEIFIEKLNKSHIKAIYAKLVISGLLGELRNIKREKGVKSLILTNCRQFHQTYALVLNPFPFSAVAASLHNSQNCSQCILPGVLFRVV